MGGEDAEQVAPPDSPESRLVLLQALARVAPRQRPCWFSGTGRTCRSRTSRRCWSALRGR
ncbi:hypothetical protein NKG94_44320 [Micromonospora sp. M12]